MDILYTKAQLAFLTAAARQAQAMLLDGNVPEMEIFLGMAERNIVRVRAEIAKLRAEAVR